MHAIGLAAWECLFCCGLVGVFILHTIQYNSLIRMVHKYVLVYEPYTYINTYLCMYDYTTYMSVLQFMHVDTAINVVFAMCMCLMLFIVKH